LPTELAYASPPGLPPARRERRTAPADRLPGYGGTGDSQQGRAGEDGQTTLRPIPSCPPRPSGQLRDDNQLAEYLARSEWTKLRRRLEADLKSLYALYEYSRLHGAVRLRWGFLDELLPAPWVHPDEPGLHALERSALAMNVPLEVVVGSAPGWAEPWSRVRLAHVVQDDSGWRTWLVDEGGFPIDEAEVQLARLPMARH
jgi:hypothetical protein